MECTIVLCNYSLFIGYYSNCKLQKGCVSNESKLENGDTMVMLYFV